MKIYVSGALQASRDLVAARALYAFVADTLANAGHQVYLPHQNTDPVFGRAASAGDVFKRDCEELFRADMVVALLNEPSLGVGAELALAASRGIKICAYAERSTKVSRFIVGLLEAQNVRLTSYDTRRDLASKLPGTLMQPVPSLA